MPLSRWHGLRSSASAEREREQRAGFTGCWTRGAELRGASRTASCLEIRPVAVPASKRAVVGLDKVLAAFATREPDRPRDGTVRTQFTGVEARQAEQTGRGTARDELPRVRGVHSRAHTVQPACACVMMHVGRARRTVVRTVLRWAPLRARGWAVASGST